MRKIVYIIIGIIIIIFNTSHDVVAKTKTKDRIHFINTGNSDAILIESNGRFGMVDSGEDRGTSRTRLPQWEIDELNRLPGFEDVVIEYLKENGVKELDFIIATHSHSDHIGSFDSIWKCFLRPNYTQENI